MIYYNVFYISLQKLEPDVHRRLPSDAPHKGKWSISPCGHSAPSDVTPT